MIYVPFALLVALVTPSTWAEPSSNVRELAKIFQARFEVDYEERRCGQNVLRLLEKARRAGIDARNARVIRVTNEGNSVFGMVNAEKARGRIRESTGEQFPPGEKNWQFHVFLELDCYVFDFDFMNSPVVLPLHDYVELMYLDEGVPELAFQLVGREEKVSHYKAEIQRGREIFSNTSNPRPEAAMWLGELLETCPRSP